MSEKPSLVEILEELPEGTTSHQHVAWLSGPAEVLGDRNPMQALLEGKHDKVMQYAKDTTWPMEGAFLRNQVTHLEDQAG